MPVALASTLDGTYVAVLRGGTVILHASDGAGEVAQASTGLDLDGSIAFAARHVLVHAVDGRRSVLSALSVPKLAIVSQLELDAPTRLLAVTHGYALLDRGDAAFVAQCTTGALAIAPLRVTTGIDRAIGLEAPQFMTWSKRGPEIWDAPTRRPNARIALALPDGVRELGVAGHQRMLWMTLGGDEVRTVRLSDGRTVSVRLPARPGSTVAHPMSSWVVTELGGVPHAVNLAVHAIERLELPAGARAVVPDGASETGAWVVVADETGRLTRVPIGGAAAVSAPASTFAGVEEAGRGDVTRPAAMAATWSAGGAARGGGAGGGAVVAAALPRAMTVSERLAQRSKGPAAAAAAAAAAAPASVPAAASATPSARASAAAPVAASAAASAAAPTAASAAAPTAAAAPATAAPSAAASAPSATAAQAPAAPSAAAPATDSSFGRGAAVRSVSAGHPDAGADSASAPDSVSAGHPDAAADFASAPDSVSASHPGSAAHSSSAHVGTELHSVPAVVLVERRTLVPASVDWRRRVVAWGRDGYGGDAPGAPPIDDLARRADLGPAGATVLAALYADWLEGNGDRGVPAATAASAAGDGAEAWREALGTGQLASLGMIVAELGRVRLLPSVGTWLDGRAPRCIEVLAPTRLAGAPVPPEGAHRVAAQVGESARACAARLASALGGVALCELDGQGVKAARQWADQGRLEAWLRDLAVATPIDLGAITPRPGERVLAIAAAGALESAGLPWWRAAR